VLSSSDSRPKLFVVQAPSKCSDWEHGSAHSDNFQVLKLKLAGHSQICDADHIMVSRTIRKLRGPISNGNKRRGCDLGFDFPSRLIRKEKVHHESQSASPFH
jgi:hypothetical protein